jgi:hypothetical protein
MVENETGDMSDRSGADTGFAAVFGAGADDHQVRLPLGRNVDNLRSGRP